MKKIYLAAIIISLLHLLFLISIVFIAYKTCFIEKRELVGFENLACGIFDPQGLSIILSAIIFWVLPAIITIFLGFNLYKNIDKRSTAKLTFFFVFGFITIIQSLFDLGFVLEQLGFL